MVTVGNLRSRAGKAQSAKGSAEPTQERTFTVEEVAKHSTEKDCWLIIEGQVYDVTKFVPRHPGGSLIYVKAGGDSTQLFYSYHPEHVHKLLSKFRVGAVQEAGKTVTYEEENCEFYASCRQKVNKYFKENNLDPRVSSSMYIKTGLILAVLAGD